MGRSVREDMKQHTYVGTESLNYRCMNVSLRSSHSFFIGLPSFFVLSLSFWNNLPMFAFIAFVGFRIARGVEPNQIDEQGVASSGSKGKMKRK